MLVKDATRFSFTLTALTSSVRAPFMTDDGPLLLILPEGHQFIRSLLKTRTKRPIHDYILEGVCKALDGAQVLSIIKTGGGKTSYFSSYIHIIYALHTLRHPRSNGTCQPTPYSLYLVYPTKGLEEEQVRSLCILLLKSSR